MDSSNTVAWLIKGQFHSDNFALWITERANKLDLTGWVQAHSNQLIELVVSGDQILIDAMEVACSLGPIDARVDTIEAQSVKVAQIFDRQPAQFVRY